MYKYSKQIFKYYVSIQIFKRLLTKFHFKYFYVHTYLNRKHTKMWGNNSSFPKIYLYTFCETYLYFEISNICPRRARKMYMIYPLKYTEFCFKYIEYFLKYMKYYIIFHKIWVKNFILGISFEIKNHIKCNQWKLSANIYFSIYIWK